MCCSSMLFRSLAAVEKMGGEAAGRSERFSLCKLDVVGMSPAERPLEDVDSLPGIGGLVKVCDALPRELEYGETNRVPKICLVRTDTTSEPQS